MIFNQLFDSKSSTYTYIISSGKGREALIIDPVIEHTEEYIKVLESLDLNLNFNVRQFVNLDKQGLLSLQAFNKAYKNLVKKKVAKKTTTKKTTKEKK